MYLSSSLRIILHNCHFPFRQKVAQMDPLHSTLYEFPDLNQNIEDVGEEADLVYELLQQKIHLHQSFHYLNLKGKAASN